MASKIIADITPDAGLEPKAKYFEEVGEDCYNADAAILLMNQVDTPEARAMRKAYRRHISTIRIEHPALSAERQREEAFFRAMKSCGFNPTYTKINGTME